MGESRLSRLIQPRSIAVIGASARRHASANQAIANLRRAKYDGALHVVHPRAERVDGIPTVSSVAQLDAVDLALVSVPAAGVMEVLTQLASAGCPAAIVPGVGMPSSAAAEIETLRRESGMAICGPNTMGIHNVADGIPLVFWEGVLDEVATGPIAIVGQSGGACLSVITSCEVAGFSRVIASGNEWGLTAADYLTWLADDPATEAVGLVVESIRDVPAFVEAVRALRSAGKPLCVLHVGRTAAGGVQTTAHTSALIGRPEVYAAFFDDLDLPVVRDYDELASVLDAYAAAGLPRPRGSAIAVATISGGVASLCADLASEAGIELPALSEATSAAVESLMPGSRGLNPFDAGGGASYTGSAFASVLVELANAPEADAVLAILDGQATLSDGELEYADEDFVAVADAAAKVSDVPIVVASTGSLGIHPRWRATVGPSVPILRGITTALTTLRALSMNARPVPPAHTRDAMAAPGPDPSDRVAVAALLRSRGIPLVDSRIARLPDEAVAAAHELGYPLAVKVSSPHVSHRSDVGGVVLGVTGDDALLRAIDTIRANVSRSVPKATIEGFELQREVAGCLEASVGFVTDPVFGPVVSVGLGGILVELTQDVAYGLAPLSVGDADALIASTHLARLASGYRGAFPRTDLRPLAGVVASLARFALDHVESYDSGDLNPVMIAPGSGEVSIVDVLLTPRAPRTGGHDD